MDDPPDRPDPHRPRRPGDRTRRHLKSIDRYTCSSIASIAALADSPILEDLQSLRIGGNPLALADYEALVASTKLPKLEVVNIGAYMDRELHPQVVLEKRFTVLTY